MLRRAVARVEEHAGDAAAKPARRALAKSPPDYYRAAEAARQALKNGWYEFLREQFDPEPGRAVAAEDSLELARKVWQLGSPLVITTNYDRVLEWVCPDVPRRWNVQEVFAQVETLKKGVQAPTVWHLHGHMDDPLSVILTVNDYKRLYRRGGTAYHRYEVALKTLHSLLVSHTFLFIGFSLDDADFALQLRELDKMFMGVTGPHYVLTQSAEEEHIRELDLPVKILTVSHYGQPLLEYVNALVENVFGGRRRNPALPPPGAARHDSPPDGGASRPLFFVPFRQKRHKVIGRTEILRKIRAGLTGSEGPYGPAVSLQGIGGLGKTQIAVEYAFHFRPRYPNGVFWIDAARNIDEQLISIAGEVNWPWPGAPPAAKLGEARTRLRTTSECLIVFDNVAHVRDIREYLPANEARSHVLITSRSEQAGFPPIPLGLLDHEESLRMLFQEAGQKPTSQRQQKAAERIARRCGGLPLALELAGAYLRYRQV
ncbi:MAG TPA: SIR2 family protein, partial [Longimicrobium sp.]|nr:SIR2 family protein [Longimicrobium sp.]